MAWDFNVGYNYNSNQIVDFVKQTVTYKLEVSIAYLYVWKQQQKFSNLSYVKLDVTTLNKFKFPNFCFSDDN